MKSVLFILGILVTLNIDGTAQVTQPDTSRQDTTMQKKKNKKDRKPTSSHGNSYIYQNQSGDLAFNYQDTTYRNWPDTGTNKRDTTDRKKRNTRDRSSGSGSGNMNSYNYDQGNYVAMNYPLAQDTTYRRDRDRMQKDTTTWPDTSYMNKDKNKKNKGSGT